MLFRSGETISDSKVDDLKVISEKLEIINLQLSQRKNLRRKIIHWFLVSLCIIIIVTYIALILLNSPYLGWNYSDSERAVIGVNLHIFEWLFIRISPIILIGSVVGILLTRN